MLWRELAKAGIDSKIGEARDIVKRCETDLKRQLTAGERRDLLKDNTRWSSELIAAIVAVLRNHGKGDDMTPIEDNPVFGTDNFEPVKWLYVIADSAEAARKFFGAPVGWQVEFDRYNDRGVGCVWRVKSEGLKISETSEASRYSKL